MRSVTIRVLIAFLVGIGTGMGLSYMSHKVSVPCIDSSTVFQVVLPDGTTKHLSYLEIERDREELRVLRERLRLLEGPKQSTSSPPERKAPSSPERSEGEPDKRHAAEAQDQSAGSSKGLKDVFTKLMNSVTLKELADEQVTREAGELSGVLGLTKEERSKLEGILRKRRKFPPFSPGTEPESSEEAQERGRPQKTLDEELRALLPPEKFARYQEYTEKKKALAGSPTLDRDLFELTYRLNLSEEQQAAVREALKEHDEKAQHLSLASTPDEHAAPLERIQSYLDQKASLEKETSRRMERILNQQQYAEFLQYQNEKSAEVRILKKLLEEEAKDLKATP